MDKKVKIIILVLSMFVVGLVTFIVVDKVIDKKDKSTANVASTNQSSNKTVNNIDNKVEKDENTVENKADEKKTDEEKKEVKDSASAAVRKALKDEEWLKKNIYVQDDENFMDGVEVGEQVINFIVCKSDNKPIVVVEVLAENIRYAKIVLVTYKDGNVVAEKINQGHIYHGAYSVDANRGVVCSNFMHGGTDAVTYHKVSGNGVKFIGTYGREQTQEEGKYIYFVFDQSMDQERKEISEEEYNTYKEGLNEKQYNFVEIGTKLTKENVDKYVK